MLTFAIVHYNTPELTKCLCGSIRKWHPESYIIIFDNSDARIFDKEFCDEYYDNTSSKIIDFSSSFEKYPKRNIKLQAESGCNFGSAKHSMSIDWLCKEIRDDFVLLDSDVLIRKPIDFIDRDFICVSDTIRIKAGLDRISPMLAYINGKKMCDLNIDFFDGSRMHGLCDVNSKYLYYDTGASFLEDISKLNLFKKFNTESYYLHYGNGSWRKNGKVSYSPDGKCYQNISFKEWLLINKELWT